MSGKLLTEHQLQRHIGSQPACGKLDGLIELFAEMIAVDIMTEIKVQERNGHESAIKEQTIHHGKTDLCSVPDRGQQD
jgi:hypothetical protein